jgi:hypothetical protein
VESIDKAASKDNLHYNYFNILIESVQDSNVLGVFVCKSIGYNMKHTVLIHFAQKGK